MNVRLRALVFRQRGLDISWAALFAILLLLGGCATPTRGVDPLPSWNEGPAKAVVINIVQDTTRPGSPDFVPPEARIATFDNDGTLWCEQPLYVEVVYTLERIRQLAATHPAWRNAMPFKAVIENDKAAMERFAEADFFRLMSVTHEGYTSAEFQKAASDWLAVTKHPRFNRLYTELVYQPMLEVLAYFRAHGYKTFIVSGGTLDFMRSFAEKAYGIPPEQVIGSSLQATYTFNNNIALTKAEGRIMLVDDGSGKAIGIDHYIGRVPIAAFGNSDGDLAMLQTTTNSPESKQYKRFAAFVWHTDAEREYAYDRDSHVGRLSVGLESAPQFGWTLINMKTDWKVIFPFEIGK